METRTTKAHGGQGDNAPATKHTPTPWAAFTDDTTDVNKPHTNIVAFSPRTACVLSLPGYDKTNPNIQFIIRAVNAHADLLAACEDAIETIQWLHRSYAEVETTWEEDTESIRAAIAKAGGGA